MKNIKEQVKAFIVDEFCDPATGASLTDETPLLSSGVIDSISALQLIDYLEQTFNIKFKAHEADQDNLNTLSRIETFIKSKLEA
jgi:D-alanine--poly(phosphoribitol) ligase subunit 2